MPVYTLSYHFKGHPQQHQLQLQQPELTPADAALHLLELHLGDAENSLTQPAADASAQAILDHAQLLGISHIKVETAPE